MNPFVIQKSIGHQDGPTIAIKDSIDVSGWVTQAGSRALADNLPAIKDADVVRLLLESGWQIVGKTVLHEFAFGVSGINDWAGTPINPQAKDLIPGGSSSGSAVAVAAGAVYASIGTDTGGSVRMPAACCGVFGFKPTFARVSRAGAYPVHSTLDCIGPFAREMAGIVDVMTAIDPSFMPATPRAEYRVGVVEVECDGIVSEAVYDALSATSWTCQAVKLPSLAQAFNAAMVLINHETWAAFGQYTGQGLLGRDVEARLLAASRTTADEVTAAELVREQFCLEVDEQLKVFDALVMPSLPRLPPSVESVRAGASILDMTAFLRPFNLSGHPALTVPVQCKGSEIKAGLQLIGPKHQDEQLCALGAVLERVLKVRR
ncbi:MAG TPA: amidase [Pseudomonas sp.]|nr:amidase [Pseudomonas sp.]